MSWFRLDVTSATIVAGVLMAVAVAARPFDRRWAAWIGAAAFETAFVCGLFALWQLANRATHTHRPGASQRPLGLARRTLAARPERDLDAEPVLGHPDLVRVSNYYYATAHLTGMLVFLVWLWLRHRDRYPEWRNVLVLFTGVSLLIQMVPVAPPRLIGGTGLVDTAMAYGQSVYAFVGSNLADQYAAMPSIHVGWALLIAAACWSCSTGWWRWVGAGHGVLTVFVVVATANHYWFDGLAAAVLLVLAWLAQRGAARAFARVRAPEPVAAVVRPATT